MSGKQNVETSEVVASAPVSDSMTKPSKKDMGKEGTSSDSVTSMSASAGNATSGFKGAADKPSASEQSVYYPPPNYDYYPSVSVGYDDKGYYNNTGGSYTGVQSDSSMLYYYPGFSPYATGYMGVDGKQTYASSDYLQQPCSYGSESYPLYTYDSSYVGNGTNSVAGRFGPAKSWTGACDTGNSNGFSASKTNNNLSRKTPVLPFNSKVQQPSNFSRPVYQNQPLKPLNKLGSSFQSANLMRGGYPAGRYSSYTNRNMYMQYNPASYQSNNRVWNNNNYRNKSRENISRNGEAEALTELTRGPRADNKNKNSKPTAEGELVVEREKYNSENFEIDYEHAKFFIIKSYSEDDVHKCIKYDVWSSTPGGNKKLDAAFREADATASETGKKCPVFLFFSVNASGQFIGLAEMIGQVDFTKNMDFWQLDKWNGFFPVKWHIIKDVPNTLLRHIILENNENRTVTYSRDTQEIFLQQGLEMLGIFKKHSEKTSVLDDFNFYEVREKALKGRRASKKATSQTNGYEKQEGITGEQSAKTNQGDAASSLVSLTRNLSLSSQPLQSSI